MDVKKARHNDGMAAVAELIVADVLGLEWTAGDKPLHQPDKGVDVGDTVQVRWSSKTNGDLLVYAYDTAPHLVLVSGPDLHHIGARGWVWLDEARREEWWKPHFQRPCFGVPQCHLRPMRDLWDLIHNRTTEDEDGQA